MSDERQSQEALVACTLTDTDLMTQQARWLNLGENFGIGRVPTDSGLELRFRYHPRVEEELRALIAVESDCCRWASWTVNRDSAGTLVMAVRSKDAGVEALHGMFTQRCFSGR